MSGSTLCVATTALDDMVVRKFFSRTICRDDCGARVYPDCGETKTSDHNNIYMRD